MVEAVKEDYEEEVVEPDSIEEEASPRARSREESDFEADEDEEEEERHTRGRGRPRKKTDDRSFRFSVHADTNDYDTGSIRYKSNILE